MRELHLFAGIGGGILGGLLLGHQCVGAVEIDPYCRQVLEARQLEGLLPPFPILEDVRAFDGTAWRGRVDVVAGGFPCQPWSSAGKRLGARDPRHLWPEMARIIGEVRPRYAFLENVSLAAFEQPFADLSAMGYRVPPALCLSAGDLGAPFSRKRWWLLAADADQVRQPALAVDDQVAWAPVASRVLETSRGWEVPASRLRRLVSGLPDGLDSRGEARARVGALGNAQVPAVAAAAFLELRLRLELEQVTR